MRKPLVVLGVAVAALVAGGVATTRAMAQEPPDDEFTGFNIFGSPLFDEDPDSDVDEDVDEDVDDDVDQDVVDQDTDQDADQNSDALSDISGNKVKEPIQPASTDPADKPSPETPAATTPAPRPAAPRIKAAAPKRNVALAAVADPIAASRTAVTADSISASPAAPVQQQILALVNRYRERSGCRPVSLDRRLIDAANRHAADMARRDYFEHESPDGDRAGERVSEAGYRWRWYGENIARGQHSPWDAMDGWMNSAEHRENILDCKLDQMGVGLALDHERTPYWVQDFATPK
jgi:uncharacterized protein YkwD